MPELHYKDGGTWRRAKELHYRDGGTWRKLKEAWYRDGGTWRKIFSGASPVSLFGGNLVAAGFPYVGAVTITLTAGTDGTFSATATVDAAISFTNDAAGDLWFAPAEAGIGTAYWVRATLTSGSAPSSGTTGAWQQLSTARAWAYNSGTGGPSSSRSGTLLLEISSDSGGASIVASGSYYIEASRES